MAKRCEGFLGGTQIESLGVMEKMKLCGGVSVRVRVLAGKNQLDKVRMVGLKLEATTRGKACGTDAFLPE
jgi:hypothetical protein